MPIEELDNIISDVKKAKQVSKKYGFNLKVINNASRTA